MREYHIAMNHLRYQVSKNIADPYWSVVDIFTGWPADYWGILLDSLDGEEVDRLVDILNETDLASRNELRRSH